MMGHALWSRTHTPTRQEPPMPTALLCISERTLWYPLGRSRAAN